MQSVNRPAGTLSRLVTIVTYSAAVFSTKLVNDVNRDVAKEKVKHLFSFATVRTSSINLPLVSYMAKRLTCGVATSRFSCCLSVRHMRKEVPLPCQPFWLLALSMLGGSFVFSANRAVGDLRKRGGIRFCIQFRAEIFRRTSGGASRKADVAERGTRRKKFPGNFPARDWI